MKTDFLLRVCVRILAGLIVLAAGVFVFAPPSLAQGPEESCGVLYSHPNYSDILLIDESIDALHGWSGPFDGNGQACFSDANVEYVRVLQPDELPDVHGAIRYSVDVSVGYASRLYSLRITAGGAQMSPDYSIGLCTDGNGCNETFTGLLAQGNTITREIRLTANDFRGVCLDHITFEPTTSIDTGGSAFADPQMDGIDYPTFYEVISSTSISGYGSQTVGGDLVIPGNSIPICTPIKLNVVSDTVQYSLHANVANGTWFYLYGAVVDELPDVLNSPQWGPRVRLTNFDGYITSTAVISGAVSGNLFDGYFCLMSSAGGGRVDDLAITACPYSPPNICPTLNNADFTAPTDWTITNTASISGGALYLPSPGDYATQPITITEDAYYNVVLTATGATSDTDRLLISLGGSDSVLILSDTLRTYNALISTIGANTISPTLRLENLTGGSVVDYICFTRAYTTNDTIVCIAPENGDFSDNSAWSFYHGGQWNATNENALLPIETEGAISQSVTLPILPDIEGGNYWILSFDAKSRYGDGTAYVSLDGPDFTDSLTFTLGTAFQTYEADASAYAESDVGLFFANINLPGYITSESDILVDNVCIHWSPNPPADPPPPRGPPQIRDIPTLTLTIDITCAEVSTWLSDTIGIDFTTLETEEPPEDLDIFGSWIWWLASKLWLYVAKPIICFLLFLWNLLAGMLETIINFMIVNFLNPLLHTINDLMLWLYAIYLFIINFAYDPFGSLKAIIKAIWDEYIWPAIEPLVNWFKAMWDDVIWPVLQPWLQPLIDAILNLWDWIQNTLWPWLHDLWVDPLGTIGALISNALQALIDWLFDMLRPIWDVFQWMLWLVGRFVGIIALILWPLWWAWDFARTLIPGLIDAITNAAQIAPLELGDFAVGYDFINGIVASTPLGAFILIVNGVLWFVFIRWAIGQFSNLNT